MLVLSVHSPSTTRASVCVLHVIVCVCVKGLLDTGLCVTATTLRRPTSGFAELVAAQQLVLGRNLELWRERRNRI